MFTFRIGGSADSFRFTLEYGSESVGVSTASGSGSLVRLAPSQLLGTLEFDFTADEAVEAVVERFVQRQSAVLLSNCEERLLAELAVQEEGVRVTFRTQAQGPALRCLTVSRVSSSGAAPEPLLRALLQHCALEGLWKLKSTEGYGNFWATACDPARLSDLRNLNLAYCGLTALPPAIGALTSLHILRLSHNKLAALPAEVGQLMLLEVLAADANLLTALPVELRRCAALRELQLEGNRIAAPVLDLRPMQHSLQSLQLYGNPLEYLPELSHCTALRSLSLANVRIMADATYSSWEVEVGPLAYMARGHKLSPLFRLTFRRASLQHPLLAGALARIAEDRANCELIAKEDVALQQLVLMALSENAVAVRQACKTLGRLTDCGVSTVRKLMTHDVGSAMLALVKSKHQELQLCGLDVLGSLAATADDVSTEIMSEELLAGLHKFISTGDPSVRQAALGCLSALCYCPANRRAVRAAPGLLLDVADLARYQPSSRAASLALPPQGRTPPSLQGLVPAAPVSSPAQPPADANAAPSKVFASDSTRLSALRVLAVLGEHELLRTALHQPPLTGRGVRVLALDGGGMKGVVLVQMLRALQDRLPQPLHAYWDLVAYGEALRLAQLPVSSVRNRPQVGTSTGAIVAVSMALLKLPLDAVEAIYTELGRKVFNAARNSGSGSGEEAPTSWRDSLYRVYRSTGQSVRVAVYGSKHDPTAFEALLQEFADMQKHGCLTDQLIDCCSLAGTPKVGIVSTLTSVTPAVPYLFRTYELPPGSEAAAAHIGACPGSSRLPVWQAVRASAAAPYYLDECVVGEDRFQDGATTANNPAVIALQQARLLWPDRPLECLVSLGCGLPPPSRRERSVSAYLDMGNVLIESACSVDRVHEALATTLPLLPHAPYYRFHPIDERMAVELDDVSPASIAKLQAAAADYCVAHAARWDDLATLLQRPASSDEDVAGMANGLSTASGLDVSLGGPEEEAGLLTDGSLQEPPASPAERVRLRADRRGLLVLHASADAFLGSRGAAASLQAATTTALAALPGLLRCADLSDTPVPARTTVHAAGTSPRHDAAHAASPITAGPANAAAPAGPASAPQPGRSTAYVKLSDDVETLLSSGTHRSSFSFSPAAGAATTHTDHPATSEALPPSSKPKAALGYLNAAPAVETRASKPPLAPRASASESPANVEAEASGASPSASDKPGTAPPSPSSFLEYFLPRWSLTAPASPTHQDASTAPPDATSPRSSTGVPQPSGETTAPGGIEPGAGHAEQALAAPQAAAPMSPRARAAASAAAAGLASKSSWFPWAASSTPAPAPLDIAAVQRRPSAGGDSGGGAMELEPAPTLTASPTSQPVAVPPGAYLFRTRSVTDTRAGGTQPSASPPSPRAVFSNQLRSSWPSALPTSSGADAVRAGGAAPGLEAASGAAPRSRSASGLPAPTQPPCQDHPSGAGVSPDGSISATPSPAGSAARDSPSVERSAGRSLPRLQQALDVPPPPNSPSASSHALPTLGGAERSPGRGDWEGLAPDAQQLELSAGLSAGAKGAEQPAEVAAAAELTAAAVVRGLLQDLSSHLGVVHLALEPDPHHAAGLVTYWASDVTAIVDPGPQAAALLKHLGAAPGLTLNAATNEHAVFSIGPVTYTRLSSQEVTIAGGKQIRSMLFGTRTPSQWLTPEEVAATAVDWEQLVVTVSSVLPKLLIEAFLQAGVKALVCLAMAPSPAQEAALPHVFRDLLTRLLEGGTLHDALHAAQECQGGVAQGCLVCHTMPLLAV